MRIDSICGGSLMPCRGALPFIKKEETLSDFNPHDIAWDKVFQLEDNETCKSVIEDMSNPVSW